MTTFSKVLFLHFFHEEQYGVLMQHTVHMLIAQHVGT